MTINKANLIHNFDLFHRHKPHYTIIPVLKSNAYGHGLKQVAGIVDGIPHCDILAVDSYPEYQIIYKYTDKTILLMGETKLENYRLFDYQRTHLAVRNMATVVELAALGKMINVHIFVNTGMNREGIQYKDLDRLMLYIKQYPHLRLVGVMSHLACADDPDHPLNALQSDAFSLAVALIRSHGFSPEYIHLEASAGMMNNMDKNGICTAGRLGIGLYGIDPCYNGNNLTYFGRQLRPVMDVYSTITAIQHIQKGESVGYSSTRNTDTNTSIATFPFGYKEGMNRELSNTDFLLRVGDAWSKMVGRVSMNYSTVESVGASVGQSIHIISSNLQDKNNIYSFFNGSKKIVYELCRFDDKIKKVVI